MTYPKCHSPHPSLCDASMGYVKGGKAHVDCIDEDRECEYHKPYVRIKGQCFKRGCNEKSTIRNIHQMSGSVFESCDQHHALGPAWRMEKVMK